MSIVLTWFGHDSFLIEHGDMRIMFDPFMIPESCAPCSHILVTHDHYDHLSKSDVRRLSLNTTHLILPDRAKGKAKDLEGVWHLLKVSDSIEIEALSVRAVPAYNVNKSYHPKTYGGLGYIVTLAGKSFYHAGDTDLIPEMESFGPVDVAFLPVSGTYVMTAEEAAEASERLDAGLVIPMHYGSFIGKPQDGETFASLVESPVLVPEKNVPVTLFEE